MRVQVGGRASEHLYFLCSSRSADQHSKSQGRKEGMKGSSRELHGDLSWKNSVYYSLTSHMLMLVCVSLIVLEFLF